MVKLWPAGTRARSGTPAPLRCGSGTRATAHARISSNRACTRCSTRLLQLLAHQLGEAVAHDADVDQIELPLDAFIQRGQQITDAAFRNDLEHVQLGLGRAADDALLGARCVDDAGAMCPVRREVVGPAVAVCAAAGEVLAPRDVA